MRYSSLLQIVDVPAINGFSRGDYRHSSSLSRRAGMLAVPSRVSQRLPHLMAHNVAETDAETRH